MWSPDSKWLAYTRLMKNHLRAAFLYSVDEGASHQVSDGMSDAQYPAFDKNGKYLYFAASTDAGLSTAWLDMSSIDRQVTYSVYLAVLNKDDPSPFAPESDDEKKDKKADADAKKDDKDKDKDKDKAKEPVKVKVDFENIGQRIVATPIPARDYRAMLAGKEGTLFLLENPPGPASDGPPHNAIWKFELKTQKTDKVVSGVRAFDVSRDGEKMLFREGDKWTIAGTSGAAQTGRRRPEDGRYGSARGSARRMEADVSRGVAHRARFLLRSESARPQLASRGEEIRAVSGAGSSAATI